MPFPIIDIANRVMRVDFKITSTSFLHEERVAIMRERSFKQSRGSAKGKKARVYYSSRDGTSAELPDNVSRKKVDQRIRSIIENGVANNHRSFFVIVGDHGKDQVVNLHLILNKLRLKRPSVLWCYKKELAGFSSNKHKRAKLLKHQISKGIKSPETENSFDLFIASTDIRYVYYRETEKVLGNTYGMCVIQDFDSMTPNLLARTVETVEGGGIVIMLVSGITSLRQLYTMTMDVHKRYKTYAHADVKNRFNERFILSLADCDTCLVVDDELTILPLTMARMVETPSRPIDLRNGDSNDMAVDDEASATAVERLKGMAKTTDQAEAIHVFGESLAAKMLNNTVSLTAARGRGKSAALGLAIANAIALGYANVFVTAPDPENLVTLFQWMLKGLHKLGYEETAHYDVFYLNDVSKSDISATSKDALTSKGPKTVVRVNIFKNHRQTVQYIRPQDSFALAQAELLIVDEAAAIPMPLLRGLLRLPGNTLKNSMTSIDQNEETMTGKPSYLIFLSSTIHGYEGTGRSLSLKLLQSIREQRMQRSLKEIKLNDPIRYGKGDPVEAWLNKLLCLELTTPALPHAALPHPSTCELYYVSRDTLFAYHPTSERFLQRIMAVYVAGHYKNSPNDLQLLSDAPAHHLFVLLPPLQEDTLPYPICVLQVCLEGGIARQFAYDALSRGKKPDGDLVPWLVSQQYQDEQFANLSGVRIVRIATHPEYTKVRIAGEHMYGYMSNFFGYRWATVRERWNSCNFISRENSLLKRLRRSRPWVTRTPATHQITFIRKRLQLEMRQLCLLCCLS